MRCQVGDRCLTMRDAEQPGLRTTHLVKEAMYIKTLDALTDDRIHFWEELVVVNHENTAEDLKRQLKEELQTYSVVVDQPKSLFAQAKKTFTGKIGGFQDDLVVCLQLNILWHSDFFKDRKYAAYW